MIHCVVFDFDGTLVLSNDIKREGFFAVIPPGAESHATMERILNDPPGDRERIFAAFAALEGGDAVDLTRKYSRRCEEGIVGCAERSGAGAMLARLAGAGIPCHINSATPEFPLRAVVRRRYGDGVFASVRGGHGAKLANLEAILASECLAASELAMVGDGVDDREAARAAGCRFVGIGGGTLALEVGGHGLLDDLRELWARLEFAVAESRP